MDDGSTDTTWDVICSQHGRNPLHCGLRLGRNAGQQNALLAGLEASIGKADCVVTADADLQDDVWALYNLYMGRSVAGWVSLILSIWFVGGCMLVALGRHHKHQRGRKPCYVCYSWVYLADRQ